VKSSSLAVKYEKFGIEIEEEMLMDVVLPRIPIIVPQRMV